MPSELVHVPARAAGPDVGAVAHAPISNIKAPAKMIRKQCCSFMAGILSRSKLTRQAQIAEKRSVAKGFVIEVEKLGGAEPATTSKTKTQLVGATLELVRAGWLFQHAAIAGRFCRLALSIFSAMKSIDVYKDALARVKADPAVIETLGSPITERFLVSGNTNVNGASGEANLSIPISSPNGKGTIYVAAKKSLGRWNYSGLTVEIEKTRQRIDLLGSSTPANSP